MTVIGGILDGPGHAIFWADGEQYHHDQDDEGSPAAKLQLNVTAPCAGAGTGISAVIRHGDRALCDATDFDLAPMQIAKALRAEAVRRADDLQAMTRDSFACQKYLALGFSPAAGRLLSWQMAGSACFVPTLAARTAWPRVPEIDAVRFVDPAAIVKVATAQIRVIRNRYPEATGGSLQIVEFIEGEVRVLRLPEWFKEVKDDDRHDDTAHCATDFISAAREDAGRSDSPVQAVDLV